MAHLAGQGGFVFLRKVVHFAKFIGNLSGGRAHFEEQVVGVDHGAFAGLHFAFREFHHAIAQVVVQIGLGEPEFLEDEKQDLEVVLLLVADRVDLSVQIWKIFEAQDGRADVLRHVHGGAIAAQQQLFVKSVFGKVHPNGAIVLLEKEALGESSFNMLLAEEIGVGFVVELVKRHPHVGVGGIEPIVNPAIHGFPKFHDL